MEKLNQDLKLMRLVLCCCVNIIEDGGSDIIRILENGKNTYLVSAMDTLAAGIYWMCKQVNEILKEAEKESARAATTPLRQCNPITNQAIREHGYSTTIIRAPAIRRE